jgi:hypothetical protein
MSQTASDSAAQKVCQAYSIALNEIEPEYDGQWQGITVASDGNCYFGSSTHSYRQGAGFFRFDPGTRELTTLADDMTAICGEDLTKTPSQGKIHSPIVEHDGWLYFTTHLSNYWKEAIDSYTGAHVIGYEMSTGRFRDFGIVRPRYSIYSFINVDPDRKRLYVFSVPFAEEDQESGGCNVYRIDIPTGEMEDLGRPARKGRNASFWSYVDLDGNCWFTMWGAGGRFSAGGQGNLYRVAAASGQIECFDDVLPETRLWPDGKRCSEELQADRSWTWAQALPGREQCLFAMGFGGGDDERLWAFNPRKNIATGAAFQPVGFIGPVFLALALGRDRVFYIQRGDPASHRGYSGEAKRDEDPDVVGKNEDYHLKSISLAAGTYGQVTDHGAIVDQKGRAPRMVDSLAADQKGRAYMVGSWHVLPGDQPTLQIDLENPEIFQTMKRGQFFAVCDVSDDIA